MSLITPDFGLIFWMTLIFATVFFILAKFGFPIITDMVEKRNEEINNSLKEAREAKVLLSQIADEQKRLIEDARKEQSRILKEASDERAAILSQAKSDATAEADKILAKARVEIAAEKESALRDIRKEVALLGVSVAEKVVRKDLSSDKAALDLVDQMVEEMSRLS